MERQVRGNWTGEIQKTGGTWGDGDDRVWDGLGTQDHWICLYLFAVHIFAHFLSCYVFP